MNKVIILLCTLFSSLTAFAHIEQLPQQHPTQILNSWLSAEYYPGSLHDYKQDTVPTILATLATVNARGEASTRLVQISIKDNNNFIFYTHGNNQKVQDMTENRIVALNLWLPKTKRQVSIKGKAFTKSTDEAKRAWSTMPRSMQINLTASDHQSPIASVAAMQNKIDRVQLDHPEKVPFNENFVGYEVIPNKFIFYAINSGSFADKFVFNLKNTNWQVERYQP